jgi:hypothetical protein
LCPRPVSREARCSAGLPGQAGVRKRRRRRLLVTTDTLERPIAAAAKIGLRSTPKAGKPALWGAVFADRVFPCERRRRRSAEGGVCVAMGSGRSEGPFFLAEGPETAGFELAAPARGGSLTYSRW